MLVEQMKIVSHENLSYTPVHISLTFPFVLCSPEHKNINTIIIKKNQCKYHLEGPGSFKGNEIFAERYQMINMTPITT
jgi:hypothetical protein